jgi:hypothetical protein
MEEAKDPKILRNGIQSMLLHTVQDKDHAEDQTSQTIQLHPEPICLTYQHISRDTICPY